MRSDWSVGRALHMPSSKCSDGSERIARAPYGSIREDIWDGRGGVGDRIDVNVMESGACVTANRLNELRSVVGRFECASTQGFRNPWPFAFQHDRRDNSVFLDSQGRGTARFVLAPERLGRVRGESRCPSRKGEDVRESFKLNLESLDIRIKVSDMKSVVARPSGMCECARVFAAHEAPIGVVQASLVQIGDRPKFAGKNGFEKGGVGMRCSGKGLVFRVLVQDGGIIAQDLPESLVFNTLAIGNFERVIGIGWLWQRSPCKGESKLSVDFPVFAESRA